MISAEAPSPATLLSEFTQYAADRTKNIHVVSWGSNATRNASGLTPDQAWTAGLSAWRLGDYGAAATYFEAVAESDRASPWTVAAGAFWAGRSYLFGRRPDQVSPWLGIAADHPDTFYGLLARRILGLPMPFRWTLDESDEAALRAVSGSPEGKRALALIDNAQYERAEQELRALVARGRPELAHGVMIVAANAGMADFAFRLQRMLLPHGVAFDSAAYPIPRWRPEGGFSTDRALIYALMRQESNFDPQAVSRAGARGVMQLMPATARYVARAAGLAGVAHLSRPESEHRPGSEVSEDAAGGRERRRRLVSAGGRLECRAGQSRTLAARPSNRQGSAAFHRDHPLRGDPRLH